MELFLEDIANHTFWNISDQKGFIITIVVESTNDFRETIAT